MAGNSAPIVQSLQRQLGADGRLKKLYACLVSPEEDLHEHLVLEQWPDSFDGRFADDVSGCILNTDLVKQARQEELTEIDRFEVG